MSKWLNLDKMKPSGAAHDLVEVDTVLIPIRDWSKQWKEADKLFRIPLWKRVVFFYRYRKQRKEMYKRVNEITSKMPTPTWKPQK